MIEYLIMVPLSYLIGSIPFGLIAGKLVAKVDIRDYGSGKIGMTNVLRTTGITAAAVVLMLDMGKAVATVVLARLLFDSGGVEAAAITGLYSSASEEDAAPPPVGAVC